MGSKLEQVAASARPIYARLQTELHAAHQNYFVSIEPESEEFFLGQTISEAVGKARQRFPDRLVHTFRIGHPAAVHFGMQQR